jgi:hypothetical protein
MSLLLRLRAIFEVAANHSLASFFIPFFMVFFGRLVLLNHVAPPQPLISDEFSYLLAGDTFASFRLTNPPHPLWQHFETINELMVPTYMSKYPPAQGIFLALGKVIFGMPWIGVLLSMALFCGLLSWTFRAWAPPVWALLGALLATDKIGIMSYWTDSFWGGGVAGIGGAMVLGSTGRLSHHISPYLIAIFTLGGGILANSRPFEGAVLLLGCTLYLLWKWFHGGLWKETLPKDRIRLALVAGLVAAPIFLAMGYYNYRVTGNVMVLPYQTFERQYSRWSAFLFQQEPSAEPVYRHDFIRRIWNEVDPAHKAFERTCWVKVHLQNFKGILNFYFGPAFVLGGFLLMPALLAPANGGILFLLTFQYFLTRVVSDIVPHYTAPAAALIFLSAIACLRTSWAFRPYGIPIGKILNICVISIFLLATDSLRTTDGNRFLFDKHNFVEKRAVISAFLANQDGLQLVFVHEGPLNHSYDNWVYNYADIDSSKVIFINDMGVDENQRVLSYYKDQHRSVWMLDDNAELTLRAYGSSNAAPVIKFQNIPPREDPLTCS